MRLEDVGPQRNLPDSAEPWGRYTDQKIRELQRQVQRLTGETKGVRQVVAAAADSADALVTDAKDTADQAKETGDTAIEEAANAAQEAVNAKEAADLAIEDAAAAFREANAARQAAAEAWKQAANKTPNWSFEEGAVRWASNFGFNDTNISEVTGAPDGRYVARVTLGNSVRHELRTANDDAHRVEPERIWDVVVRARVTSGSATIGVGAYVFNKSNSGFAHLIPKTESLIPADGWVTLRARIETNDVTHEFIAPLVTAQNVVGNVVEFDAVEFKDVTDAVLAQTIADAAAFQAAQALSKANDAQDAADEAQGTADQAVQDALAAKNRADQAHANAAAAQGTADSAAQAAASAAGIATGKADVLIQSSTPAVAMRKATTLWIDTTGGANTPKRWSGSAWVTVTDKAATDAANAAANAKSAADAAQAAADAAQATADAAQDHADAAMDVATSAQESASVALEQAKARIRAGSNIIINGSFEDGELGWTLPTNFSIEESTLSRTGTHVLQVAAGEIGANYAQSDWYPVNGGTVLEFDWFGFVPAAATNGVTMGLGVLVRKSSGAEDLHSIGADLSDFVMSMTDPRDTWVRKTTEFLIPEDVVEFRVVASAVTASGTSPVYYDDITVHDVTNAVEARIVGEEALLGIDSAVVELTESFSSEVSQTSEQILSTVSDIYSAKTDMIEEIGLIQSQIDQQAENIDFRFIEVSESVIDLEGELQGYQSELATYIRFNNEGIELGKVGNPFITRLSNTELAFYESGQKVAHISNNQLNITNATINNNLAMGTGGNGYFDWIPRENGNLSFKFRED